VNSSITTAAVECDGHLSLQTVSVTNFGECCEPLSLRDQEREIRIAAEGLLLRADMLAFQRTGVPDCRASALKHQDRMFEMIKGRTDAVRERIAAERGLL
jgi:hypothetical protein